jgi:hypothetical protein
MAIGGANRRGADRGAMPSATTRLRNRKWPRVVKLSRRILSTSQTLKVRPQPGRRCQLLQKTRRARRVLRWGLVSSNPWRKPWRMRAPTVRQCGHGINLSRKTSAFHSSSSRQNQHCSATIVRRLPKTGDCSGTERCGVSGVRRKSHGGDRGGPKRSAEGRRCRIAGARKIRRSDGNSAIPAQNCDQSEGKDSETHVMN